VPRPERLYRTAREALDLPPRAMWPYALPGAALVNERRWQRRLERAPILTPEEHAARVGVKDIEQPIGCSLCAERRMQALFRPQHPDGRWSYHVVRCPSCGLLYRHPGIQPDRLGELYAGKYSRFLTGKYGKKRVRRYRLVMDAFSPLFDDGAGRRLLDFGCGAGIFLELAHERGFDGWGVDLSRDSIEEARRRPGGSNTYYGAPTDVPEIAAGGFDVVTMWSVLAHLTDPVEDLAMLRGLLKPDGVLLLLTVNANSLELKARGPAWSGFTRNHLKFFSPTTLPIALRKAGFAAILARPMYGDTVEAGTTKLSARSQRRLRRTIDDGNRGNMLRAVAFADADGPRRWGLDADAVAL
jgi:2-polyprenyl-3-methyl-5-hydroxy-6-metoxy-1,4-benzoquinol methylase